MATEDISRLKIDKQALVKRPAWYRRRVILLLPLVVVILAILLFANLANTVSEFAGVAASMEIFGISKYISVPIAAVGVWLLIVKGSYKSVERIFLVASAIYFSYVASGLLAHPSAGTVLRSFSILPSIGVCH